MRPKSDVKLYPVTIPIIPKEIRDSLGIQPGEKVQIFKYENRIELIPLKNVKKIRGYLKGIDTTVKREK